jgi:hypothetical protein
MKREPYDRQGKDSEELPKASDQLPEEGPAAQVAEDDSEAPEGAARESARRHARRAGTPHHQEEHRETGGPDGM